MHSGGGTKLEMKTITFKHLKTVDGQPMTMQVPDNYEQSGNQEIWAKKGKEAAEALLQSFKVEDKPKQ